MAEGGRRIIKKVSGGHGHHGGAWKVAYADFVTAMMALFMVMWLLASSDDQTRKEIANYFRTGILPEGDLSMNRAAQVTPSVIESSPIPPAKGQETLEEETATDLRNSMAQLAQIDTQLAQVIRNVHVEVTEDGVLLEIVDEDQGLLFELSSSKLKEPLEHFLHVLAPLLAQTNAMIEINGHTDARPFANGAKVSNWDLSYQRAAAAREQLVASGVDDKKVSGVFARGSSQLYVKDDPYAAQNRRLSILVKAIKPVPKQSDAVKTASSTPAPAAAEAKAIAPKLDAAKHAAPATPADAAELAAALTDETAKTGGTSKPAAPATR